MWFNNICVFQIDEQFPLEAAQLTEKLAERSFKPCLSQDMSSAGWYAPLAQVLPQTEVSTPAELIYTANHCHLVCLQTEEKILPAQVIKEYLAERVNVLEGREQRRLRRAEKEQLADELIMELLPRAFVRHRLSYAYVDTQHNWLVINSASAKGITEITENLRKTVGSLPISPLTSTAAPAVIMTQWLQHQQLPGDWQLADECELRDNESVIRCKGQDLLSEEIKVHLDAGKQVTRLALQWDDRLSMLLCDDLILRRFKMLDVLEQELAGDATDDPSAAFDARFTLLNSQLPRCLSRLLEIFEDEKPA